MGATNTTDEMTQNLRQIIVGSESPVCLVDPETHQEYYVVRAELYLRVEHLLYDDQNGAAELAYSLADETFRGDWDNTKMAEYDRYDFHKK